MRKFVAALALFAAANAAAQGFDHEHKAWDALLKRHVVLVDGGKGSAIQSREQKAGIEFLEYDWRLNAAKR